MRTAVLSAAALLTALPGLAQLDASVPTVDSKALKINGMQGFAAKGDIIKTFGQPAKVFEPNYECGFFSASEQGKKYYALQYQGLQFIGNAAEGYTLDNLELKPGAKYTVTLKGKALSNRTSQQEVERMFGVKAEKGSLMLRFTNADDALLFTFAGGFLTRIEHWTPC